MNRLVVRISPQAYTDVADTLRFTEVRLGEALRSQYQDLLQVTFSSLAEEPIHINSRERDEISPGLRSLHLSFNMLETTEGRTISPRHVVFYRIGTDQVIEIIRILHDAMEDTRHLQHLL